MFKAMGVAAMAAVVGGTLAAAGEPGSAEAIALRIVRDRFVIVPVRVDGSGPYPFLLDTGCRSSMVAPQLAARLGLPSAGSTLQETAMIARRVGLVRASLALGDVQVRDLEVLATPLDAIQDIDPAIAGVLGQDVLRAASWWLDYRTKTLVADPDGARLAATFGHRVPVHWQEGRPAVDVAWPGHKPLRLVLDSGATSLVLFRQGDDDVESAGWAQLTTYLGEAAVPLVTMASLRVGSVSLPPLAAARVPSKEGERPGEDGLLPLRLFDRVYFDNRRGAVVLDAERALVAARR